MQTGRDAINSLLRHESADFVPIDDSIWYSSLQCWTEQGMPKNPDGKPVDPVDHFGFDIASTGWGFAWEAKLNQSEVTEETEDWKIVRNGSGGVLRWWKTRTGTPEHLDFHMTSREIWETEYKPHLNNPEDRHPDPEVTRETMQKRRAQGKWVKWGGMFIWEILRATLGDVNMFMAFLEDPDWIHDMNRTYTDIRKECFRIMIEEAGKPDGIWIYEDLGYKHSLFCSPETLSELIFPYYAEVIDFLHGYDIPVVLHSCGYQEPMIPLAIDAGFDGLNPMEAKAGNDLLKYGEMYGDQLCFFGGLDARVLERGDEAEIEDEVHRLVYGMKERNAGFIFGSDHSVSTNVSYRSFCHAIETCRAINARG